MDADGSRGLSSGDPRVRALTAIVVRDGDTHSVSFVDAGADDGFLDYSSTNLYGVVEIVDNATSHYVSRNTYHPNM